jgi:hypothetical protein
MVEAGEAAPCIETVETPGRIQHALTEAELNA